MTQVSQKEASQLQSRKLVGGGGGISNVVTALPTAKCDTFGMEATANRNGKPRIMK